MLVTLDSGCKKNVDGTIVVKSQIEIATEQSVAIIQS